MSKALLSLSFVKDLGLCKKLINKLRVIYEKFEKMLINTTIWYVFGTPGNNIFLEIHTLIEDIAKIVKKTLC